MTSGGNNFDNYFYENYLTKFNENCCNHLMNIVYISTKDCLPCTPEKVGEQNIGRPLYLKK